MYPLWEIVIQPTLKAAGARRVVEIGALQGQTTEKLLDLLGDEAELHVIDPVPQFDPSEHQQRFPGRYHFHRDTSHNVLPALGPVDAALIDGDHNWYTVYNELKLLAASADEAGAPLPLLILHDVGWPYGRRDLYYAPERIPEEYRQPYAQKGLRMARGPRGRTPRGKTELLESGGFNSKMNNALLEGGPRNGVMTALEDFLEESDRDLRLVVLPIYFNLALVAEESLIAARPELAEAFDRLESLQFMRQLLQLAETLRVKEMNWSQVVYYRWQETLDRSARRYLDLLQADLGVRAPSLDPLGACLQTIRVDKVDGDFVQCGGTRGAGPLVMRAFSEAYEMASPCVWVLETQAPGDVEELFRRFELLDERLKLLSGEPREALSRASIEKIALLRLGPGSAVPDVLDLLYDRVTLGGYVLLDGDAAPEARDGVARFMADRGVGVDIEPVGPGGGVAWRKLR